MAEQTGPKVDPDALRTAGTRLAGAAEGIRKSALLFTAFGANGPSIEDWFGPARDVAARYAAIRHDFPGHVESAVARLDQGAQVFTSGADRFELQDWLNSLGLTPGFPPR